MPPDRPCPIGRKQRVNPWTNSWLVLSEFNIDFPIREPRQFFEFERLIPATATLQSVNLKDFRLLILDGVKREIIVNCDLSQIQMKRDAKDPYKGRYVVIGSEGTPNVDMTFDQCTKSWEVDTHFIPKGKHPQGPYAMALVLNRTPGYLKNLDLLRPTVPVGENRVFPLNLDNVELGRGRYPPKKVIRDNLQEFVVFGGDTSYEACQVFHEITDGWMNRDDSLIVRDYQGRQSGPDFSVNWCDRRVSAPFSASMFMYSVLTPGTLNKCHNVAFDFWTAIDMNRFSPPNTLAQPIVNPQEECYAYRNAENRFREIDVNAYSEAIVNKFQRRDPEVVPVAAESLRLLQNCGEFPAHLKEIIQQQGEILPVGLMLSEPYCTWLDYIPILNVFGTYVDSPMRCRICNDLLNNIFPDDFYKEDIFRKHPIVSDAGYIRPYNENHKRQTKSKNKQHLEEHVTYFTHLIALQLKAHLVQGLTVQEAKVRMMKEKGPYRDYFQATINLYYSVVQAIKMNLPFSKFQPLQELLRFYDVETGILFRSPKYMRLMSMTIGKVLRNQFISDMKARPQEFSIQMDTSTDIRRVHTMVVIIYYFDKDMKNIPHLYKVIQLSANLKAVTLFEQLKAQIVEDGLEEIFRQKLTGFSSDGEVKFKSAMKRLLTNYVGGRFILGVHCLSHRLEISLKNMYKKQDYFRDIDENVINKLYHFYKKSSKAASHLQDTIKKCKDNPFTFNFLYPVRWINSRFIQLEKIYNKYGILLLDLHQIVLRRLVTISDYNLQSGASDLIEILTDRNFILHLGFLLDYTAILKELSLELQKTSTTLIGKTLEGDRVRQRLHDMKTRDGRFLRDILQNSECDGVICLDVQSFENAAVVVYQKETLINHDPVRTPKLSESRVGYLTTAMEELEYFFPDPVAQYLDVFDPQLIRMGERPDNNKMEEINRVFQYGYGHGVIYRDVLALLNSIRIILTIPEVRKKSTEETWQFLYTHEFDPPLAWTDVTKRIIRTLLSVPASSAEVERMYSAYNRLKTQYRSCLDTTTVEELMRSMATFRTESLADINVWPFVTQWFRDGHHRADDLYPKEDMPKIHDIDDDADDKMDEDCLDLDCYLGEPMDDDQSMDGDESMDDDEPAD